MGEKNKHLGQGRTCMTRRQVRPRNANAGDGTSAPTSDSRHQGVKDEVILSARPRRRGDPRRRISHTLLETRLISEGRRGRRCQNPPPKKQALSGIKMHVPAMREAWRFCLSAGGGAELKCKNEPKRHIIYS